MKINKKAIFNYINKNFHRSKIQLDKYILEISKEIIDNNIFVDSMDNLVDYYCDNTSVEYEDLSKFLVKMCVDSKVPISIKIQYEQPYYYIENTEFGINSFEGNRSLYIDKLNNISLSMDKSKGKFYEKFCTLFLNDIGIEVKNTNYSRDYGIDILGKFKVSSNSKIIDMFFCKEIHLLVQAKFYSNKVDTPVIRKIIGDSLFYKFNNSFEGVYIGNNPLLLVIFSHNGFYDAAKKFAQNNNVVLLDSSQIIDMLCNMENTKNLSSIVYLNSYKVDSKFYSIK